MSGLGQFLVPVQKVKLNDIQVEAEEDRRYLFRTFSEDPEIKKHQEDEIYALADSIKKDGLIHPLVLIEKENGKYIILCGYRRFMTLRHLEVEWVDAKVYKAEDLTEEERLRISLAENERRKELDRLEKGLFLLRARENGGGKTKSYSRLGKEYGEELGIGVSPSCVEKHIKLAEMHSHGESPEIVQDASNGTLPFEIIGQVYARMPNADDRNILYTKIHKPFSLTRPQVESVKETLEKMGNGNGLKATIESSKVQQAIKKAKSVPQEIQKKKAFLELLGPHTKKSSLQSKVDALRKSGFGKNATEKDFNIEPGSNGEDGIFVQFKLTSNNFDDTIAGIKKILGSEALRKIVDGSSGSDVKPGKKSKKRASKKAA